MKLKTSHRYYSQVTMLIAIAQARQTYFVLWTTKHLLIEKIEFSAEHWNKQHSTAVFFFQESCVAGSSEKENYVVARNATVL